MKTLQFWYEFASTYSYLSAMRIEDLCREADIRVEWCPFLLGPIFRAQGWESSPFNVYEAKGHNMWRDMERLTAKRGLPAFTRPVPFPQNSLLAARVATIGVDDDWGPDFTRAMYSAEFAQGATLSDEGVIQAILDDLGLDGAAVIARARTDDTIKATLRHRTETAQELGIFGAPSFVTPDKELFWGDDRLQDAIDWVVSH